MAAAEVEAEKRVKRRSWGKARHRDKVDPMDVDQIVEQIKQADTKPAVAPSTDDSTDLQHPELLSDDRLVEVLAGMRVQVPVYSDGRPSRERLIYLFRKHVTPRPQREGCGRRRQGDGRRWRGAVAMEVDHDRQRSDWSDGDSGTTLSAPPQRKR